MKSFLLTFELNSDKDEVFIHADENGLNELRDHLDVLLSGEDHVHLKTPAWAGDELTEEVQAEGNILINHVKIFCWRK